MQRHDLSDHELMERIQRGDEQAFRLLWSRYAHPLTNFFYQMCYDRVASEDYVQETFLRVWRARATYRPIGKVSTWLYQIAKHYWFNEREKQKRRPFHAVAGGDDAQAAFANIADGGGDTAPDAVATAGETRRAIEEAVSALSEKLRVVFVLARYRGLPYGDIAEIVDIPVGTVKSRMSLAERQLRASLARYLEADA